MNVLKVKSVMIKAFCVALVFLVSALFIKVNAETVTYPFAKGDSAFENAPTWYGDASQASSATWEFLQANFAQQDLSSTDKEYYIAVQIKMQAGNPGFTFGLMGNGDRYGTYVDGKTIYLLSSTGEVTETKVLYGSINVGANFEGAIVAPLSSMSWVSWASANKSLAKVSGVFFETNAQYNWNFNFALGEIGVYAGDFKTDGTFTKVFDLSKGEKKTSYYNARQTENPLVFPSDTKDPYEGQTVAYPFAKGDLAFKNTVLWNGVTQSKKDNWQTLKVNFEATDLTDATFVAVQYAAKSGAPGLTYGLENGSARYSLAGVADGEAIYMAGEDGVVSLATKVQYASSNISKTGMLLIPMKAMNWQFGKDADKSLTAVTKLVFTTNSLYNWNFEVLIGEVGYYTGKLGESDFQFNKLIDLSKGEQSAAFTCTSDIAGECGRISVNKIDQKQYGDTTIEVFGTNKSGSDFSIWSGGSFGEVTMGKDSYGDDAIVMKSTGANPTGDAYTAITLADGIAYDWSGKKGVSLWARNDSDTEISFNIQLDCLVDVDNDGTKDRGRFNITQGNLFWLYDVNTGKETMYMTRPEVTLPVGFEGWVRIPFTAFHQAAWSLVDPNHKVIPESYFMSKGSVVGYLAITIDSRLYTEKQFAINKLGCYEETPYLITPLIAETPDKKSIKTLMGLN